MCLTQGISSQVKHFVYLLHLRTIIEGYDYGQIKDNLLRRWQSVKVMSHAQANCEHKVKYSSLFQTFDVK